MAKRYIFTEQYSDSKRAKLDITVSDHNFPISQKSGTGTESNNDKWGDDNDDEILLLASQACEHACAGDESQLPEYSMCMQPESTSTQFNHQPSTSKTEFVFKKPTSNLSSVITKQLKDKCSRISSPLPGITKAMLGVNEQINVTDDLIFNDKIYKSHDSDYLYRQLLQLQEENVKLKSENGRLLEKCVTKEGEASILRTQLKSCHAAVDNARLERVKAQEKIQSDWMEKFTAVNNQLQDLKTQLDFKNLEIISIKEKQRMLESPKIKLTQVTATANDVSMSHKLRGSVCASNDFMQSKKIKTVSSSVQTENKALLLKLHRSGGQEAPKLIRILPIIIEPTSEQHSILEYNEKLHSDTDNSQNKCRIFSTFHRIPSNPSASKEKPKNNISINSVYEDVTYLVSQSENKACLEEKYHNVLNVTTLVLQETEKQLEMISQRMTTSFQKEMDEKYIETSTNYTVLDINDLLKGRALYKEEQSILARRLVALVATLASRRTELGVHRPESTNDENSKLLKMYRPLLDAIVRTCTLLDSNLCAVLYSGLVLSVIHLMSTLTFHVSTSLFYKITLDAVKSIITSRCMPLVFHKLMNVMTRMAAMETFPRELCSTQGAGNLKLDYEQGVLLYKRDSCMLQIYLKQLENVLECIEKQRLSVQAHSITRDLLCFYHDLDNGLMQMQDDARCDCNLVLIQVVIYALSICSAMVDMTLSTDTDGAATRGGLVSVCRRGVQLVYGRWVRDPELASRLHHYEGHLLTFCDTLTHMQHPHLYANMLSELFGSLQITPEDRPTSFHMEAWEKSFQNFSLLE